MAATKVRRFSLIKKRKVRIVTRQASCAIDIDRDLSRIEIHMRTFFIVYPNAETARQLSDN